MKGGGHLSKPSIQARLPRQRGSPRGIHAIIRNDFFFMDTISLLCIQKWLPGFCTAQTLQEAVTRGLKGAVRQTPSPSVPSHGNALEMVAVEQFL